MARVSGQWCCVECAERFGYEWGVGQNCSPKGWCGVGHHRVQTQIEFIPGGVVCVEVEDPLAGLIQASPSQPKPAAPTPEPAPVGTPQMELF